MVEAKKWIIDDKIKITYKLTETTSCLGSTIVRTEVSFKSFTQAGLLGVGSRL
jgi:hypothetical protein